MVVVATIPGNARAAGNVSVCDDSNLNAALAGGGLVTFSCSGTISPLGSTHITTDTIIDATGQTVTLDGEARFRAGLDADPHFFTPVFVVHEGARLTLRNLSFVNMRNLGHTERDSEDYRDSPPIVNWGMLIVESSSFRDGKIAGWVPQETAGAIVNIGHAEIRNSEFVGNVVYGSAMNSGGAIWSSGRLIVENSSFIENGGCGRNIEPPHCSNEDGVMLYSGGAIYINRGDVTISDTLFASNSASPFAQPGAGAIWFGSCRNLGLPGPLRGPCSAEHVVAITNSQFLNNIGVYGAIYISPGDEGEITRATIHQTQFIENESWGSVSWQAAAAIRIAGRHDLLITESEFIGNNGWYAIFNSGGFGRPGFELGPARLSIVASAFRENFVDSTIINGFHSPRYDFPGHLEIKRSEFSNNGRLYPGTRGSRGGAIINLRGTASIANSTFFGNQAFVDRGGGGTCFVFPPDARGWWCAGHGGAIYNVADLTLTNVTIAWNHSEGPGTGVYNAGNMKIRNTLILDDEHSRASCVNEGTFDDDDSSFSDPGLCPMIYAHPLEFRLGAPTGSPAVLPLLAGSLAIDRGSDVACAEPIVEGIDQRGVPRPYDGDWDGIAICDIGAYESTNRRPVVAAGGTITVDEGQLAWHSGSVSDPDGDSLALSASIGSVEDSDGDGIWVWRYFASDGPSDSATVLIEANDGSATSRTTFQLIVRNVAPTVVAPDSRIVLTSGETLLARAEYSDPSPVDTHVSTIDFGLGSGPEPATIEVTSPGRGITHGEKRYLAPGIYTVNICVTDDDGGTGCDTLEVEVRRIRVNIDIKPGSFPNSINLVRGEIIPVAILSGTDFDATQVVSGTACFGDAEDASQRDCTEEHGTVHLEDANRDKRTDAVLHFETTQTGIDFGDTEACITAQLTDGRFIMGCDSIRTLTR